MSSVRLGVWRALGTLLLAFVVGLAIPATLSAQGGGEGDSVSDAIGRFSLAAKQLPSPP